MKLKNPNGRKGYPYTKKENLQKKGREKKAAIRHKKKKEESERGENKRKPR